MRLLGCVAALRCSPLSQAGRWIVRRRAGEIQSKRYQSWLAFGASAIRKPVALFLLMCGGGFCPDADRPPASLGVRLVCSGPARSLPFSTPVDYLFALGSFSARSAQSKKRMYLRAERTESLLEK